MGYFDDFRDPAMKELVESAGLIHDEVDEAREVPMNFHVRLLNRGKKEKPVGVKQGPPRAVAKFDIMHGDSDPSKEEPLERKRRGAFFDLHSPGSGERAGDKVRAEYSGVHVAGQASATSQLGGSAGVTPDSRVPHGRGVDSHVRAEGVGDYGLGDLTEDPASQLAQARSDLSGSAAGRDALKSYDNSREFAGKFMSTGSSVGSGTALSKPNTTPLAASSGSSGSGDSGRPTSSTSTRSGAPYVLNKGERAYVDPYDSRGQTVAQATASYHRTADRSSANANAEADRKLAGEKAFYDFAAKTSPFSGGGSGAGSAIGGTMKSVDSVMGMMKSMSGMVRSMSGSKSESVGDYGLDAQLDEGFGAIAHHYHYARHGNGVNSASAGAQGSSDGGAQPTVGRRNEQMSRVEASWAAKRAADIYDIRNRHFAHGTVQEQTFRVGQVVESQTGIITTSGRLGVGAKGTVKSIGEDRTVTVEFRAPIGEQKFAPDVMSAYFAPIKTESMRSIIRKAITEPPVTVEDHPNPGDRVVCENGFQYAVERRDAMGRMIQVTDHLGRSHMFNAGQIKKLPENTEFVRGVVGHQLSENLQSVPLNPGQKVTVATIDPIYNQWRVFPVYAGEAEGFLGATGMVEFAMYPVSSGTRMYRVLFEKGGRRDFSEAELTGAHEAGTVNPGI